jgi:two-component system sensor histidine kinase RpfC
MQMPDVSGVDVIKQFRKSMPDSSHPPFMMLTANATVDAQEQCRKLGVRAFLTKPVRSGQLVAIVDEIMSADGQEEIESRRLLDRSEQEADEQNILVVDPAVIADLAKLSMNPAFLDELVINFNQDSESLLDAMREALAKKQVMNYRESAHALAGNAAGMGALMLKAACDTGSGVDQAMFNAAGEKLLAETEAAYQQTCDVLQELLFKRKRDNSG